MEIGLFEGISVDDGSFQTLPLKKTTNVQTIKMVLIRGKSALDIGCKGPKYKVCLLWLGSSLSSLCILDPEQGLSQDFKNACPKQQCHNLCPSRFSDLSTLNPIYQLYLIAKCIKKGNLHFSYVLEDGFLGNFGYYIPISKLKNHHGNFCLSKQEVFRNYLSKGQVGTVG